MRGGRIRGAVGLLAFLSMWAIVPTAQAQLDDDSGSSVAHDDSRAFGAPADGVVRFSPRWDTIVFTEGRSLFGGGTGSTTSWASLFSLEVDLGFLVLRAIVPFSFGHLSNTVAGRTMNDDQAELGNLTFEGYANIELGPEHRLLVGGGIALPTATDQRCGSFSEGCIRGPLVRTIAWVTSFRSAAAWADQSFSIVPTAEYRLGIPWFLFSAIGAIPVFIPTDSRLGGPLARGNVELMLALDVSGAVRIVNIVDVGISFLAWAMPSGAGMMGNPDLGQTALSFFVRTDPELDAPITGGAEFILDLDNSWGPTGDNGKFWGLRLFIGGRFDV